MIWDSTAVRKLSTLFNMKYTDEFAHFEIGAENYEIPAWENYLEEIGATSMIASPPPAPISPAGVVLLDPRFINVYRTIPADLAEKIIVLGEFPVRQEV